MKRLLDNQSEIIKIHPKINIWQYVFHRPPLNSIPVAFLLPGFLCIIIASVNY